MTLLRDREGIKHNFWAPFLLTLLTNGFNFPPPLFFGCIVFILYRSDLGKHISLPPTRRQMLLVLTKKREHTVIPQNSSSPPSDLQICSLIISFILNYILHPKKGSKCAQLSLIFMFIANTNAQASIMLYNSEKCKPLKIFD